MRVKSHQPAPWSRLDNAAKIFPPTSDREDTKVFRFACELSEEVDPALLQQALDRTVEDFPLYLSVIKKGMFWYYFERSNLRPTVHLECKPPCSPLYDGNRKGLLFEVTCYKRRISLEVYHALSDGTGALQFLRTLVARYLVLRHPERFPEGMPPLDYDASGTQKMDDSFQKYYGGAKRYRKDPAPHAFRLRGEKTEDYRLKVVSGVMSASSVLKVAHSCGATLTVLLAAVLIEAIHGEMPLREEGRPVVLTVPVNLRSYFPSASARNFFGIFNVGYNFKKQPGTFEDILSHVGGYFKRELTAERLALRMNELAALEHNLIARAVPLAFKDVSLRIANRLSERGITAALSNVGRISMPAGMEEYIRLFDVFTSTNRLQLCLCSFGDRLVLSFSSTFAGVDVQRRFFRRLAQLGIDIEITTNQLDGQ